MTQFFTKNASSAAVAGRDHLPRLDAIRGIAILMVVFFHTFMNDPVTFGQRLFQNFVGVGGQGVPIFFVLSGFLISLIVFESPAKFQWPNYSVRRIGKIIPPFILSLMLCAAKKIHDGDSLHDMVEVVIANLATLPNFLEKWQLLNGAAWSLLVEIHFYLLLPALFFCWRAVAGRHAERLTIASFFLIPVIFRMASWTVAADSIGERVFFLNRFPCALDYFGFGMLFCNLYRCRHGQGWLQKNAHVLSCGGLLLLPVLLVFQAALPFVFHINSNLEKLVPYESARLFICVLGFFLLFCIWPQNKPSGGYEKIFDNRSLQYIGLVSYEWFLFHNQIIPSIRFHLGKFLLLDYDAHSKNGDITLGSAFSFGLLSLLTVAISFAACATIYHFFSQPLLKRIRSLAPKKSPKLPAHFVC